MVRIVSRSRESRGDLGRDAASNERFVDVLERDVRRRKSMLEIRSNRMELGATRNRDGLRAAGEISGDGMVTKDGN
jgi:hypothetical protein